MFGLKETDMEIIIRVLKAHPEIEEVTLFGSRAMGNYKPGSDIDLALKGEVDDSIAVKISVELNEHTPLPYMFDIVAYPTLSHAALKEHIDRQGKLFYRRQSAKKA